MCVNFAILTFATKQRKFLHSRHPKILSASERRSHVPALPDSLNCAILLTHELQYYVQYRYNVNRFCKEVMIIWEHISFDILLFFIA